MWCYGLSPPIKLRTFALCEANEVVLERREDKRNRLKQARTVNGHKGCQGYASSPVKAQDGLIVHTADVEVSIRAKSETIGEAQALIGSDEHPQERPASAMEAQDLVAARTADVERIIAKEYALGRGEPAAAGSHEHAQERSGGTMEAQDLICCPHC